MLGFVPLPNLRQPGVLQIDNFGAKPDKTVAIIFLKPLLQQTTDNKPQTQRRYFKTRYLDPSRLIIDFAADIPDRSVGSNPLSPAQPPTKVSPLMGEWRPGWKNSESLVSIS